MATAPLTFPALMATGITMVVVTSLVAGSRLVIGILDRRKFSWDDGWLVVAYIIFMAISCLYLVASPTIFRLQDLVSGKIDLYPTVADDGLYMQKTFFVTTSGLWICLWTVKFSLLALYKKLLKLLPLYIKLWWVVVAICVLVC